MCGVAPLSWRRCHALVVTLYIGGRKSFDLVTEGPYSVTRNPIYLGTLLLTLLIGVWSQSGVFLLTIILVSTAYLALTVPAEEDGLQSRHGTAFRAYCKRVPRLVPNFRLFHSSGTVDVQASGLLAEALRMCRWAWIPILCSLATHLRSEAWWPAWFSLP